MNLSLRTLPTLSGRRLDLENPDPSDIDIADIAVSLSRECAFSGQSVLFYSLAQHSVLVSRECPPELALEGLLHEASVALSMFLLSRTNALSPEEDGLDLSVARKRIDAAIRHCFGLPVIPSVRVLTADRRVLATEFRDVLTVPSSLQKTFDVLPLDDRIVPFSSEKSLGLFLTEYRRIQSGERGDR